MLTARRRPWTPTTVKVGQMGSQHRPWAAFTIGTAGNRPQSETDPGEPGCTRPNLVRGGHSSCAEPQALEAALSSGYELGRDAVAAGVSILDLARIHHELLVQVLTNTRPEEVVTVASAASEFLLEVLAPYDMTQRALLDRGLASWQGSQERCPVVAGQGIEVTHRGAPGAPLRGC